MGMRSAAGKTALLPHLFSGGKRPDGAAPPSPTHRLHKATAQARGSPRAMCVCGGGLSRAGTLGRGRDARARGHPQHRTAAASCSTRGRRIAPSPLPAPRSSAAPLGCRETATVKCSPAPGAGPVAGSLAAGMAGSAPRGQVLSRGALEGGDPSWARLPAGTRSFCFANPEIDSSKERRERKRLLQSEGRGSAGRIP